MKKLYPINQARQGRLAAIIIYVVVVLCTLALCTSCNVTRTIVTKSEYSENGETKTVIESRTVESYDASKKLTIY